MKDIRVVETERRKGGVILLLILCLVFRWEVIAQFVNEHSSDACEEKTSAQVIEKVKSLRKLGM